MFDAASPNRHLDLDASNTSLVMVLPAGDYKNFFVCGRTLPLWITVFALLGQGLDSNATLGNVALSYKCATAAKQHSHSDTQTFWLITSNRQHWHHCCMLDRCFPDKAASSPGWRGCNVTAALADCCSPCAHHIRHAAIVLPLDALSCNWQQTSVLWYEMKSFCDVWSTALVGVLLSVYLLHAESAIRVQLQHVAGDSVFGACSMIMPAFVSLLLLLLFCCCHGSSVPQICFLGWCYAAPWLGYIPHLGECMQRQRHAQIMCCCDTLALTSVIDAAPLSMSDASLGQSPARSTVSLTGLTSNWCRCKFTQMLSRTFKSNCCG
jgi:hypothetical protein